MRYLLSLLFILSFNALGADIQIPALSAPVMDEAGFLSASQRDDLSKLAYEIYTHKGPQITVLTVNDLQGYPIEDFSIRVAEKWQLGTKKEGNGLLILIAKAERQMRIEVGEGIEGEITDYESNQYIRHILTPAFKQGDFHGGLKEVMLDIGRKFNIQTETKQRFVRRSTHARVLPKGLGNALPFIILILVIGQLLLSKKPLARGIFTGAAMTGVGFFIGAAGIAALAFLFFFGLVVGLVGIQNLLYGLAAGSGGRYRGGGGFGGGGGSWSGGGGGFSGGGSSGSW